MNFSGDAQQLPTPFCLFELTVTVMTEIVSIYSSLVVDCLLHVEFCFVINIEASCHEPFIISCEQELIPREIQASCSHLSCRDKLVFRCSWPDIANNHVPWFSEMTLLDCSAFHLKFQLTPFDKIYKTRAHNCCRYQEISLMKTRSTKFVLTTKLALQLVKCSHSHL